jgi:hypothetical protein
MVPTPPRETVRISENQQQKKRQPGIKKRGWVGILQNAFGGSRIFV